MKELISLSEYILKRSTSEWSAAKRLSAIIGYTEFLNLPLKLGMFIPVHEEFILSKPNYYESFLNNYYLDKPGLIDYESCHRYKKAEDNILFQGFQQDDDNDCAVFVGGDEMIYVDDEFCENMTIEKFHSIIISKLKFTESAIKKYNL